MTTYCPTKSEVSFYNIDYSELSVKKILRDYYNLKESCLYKPNFELVSILSDIYNAIVNCQLTKRQMEIIKLYMLGYTETEIGSSLEISQQSVNKTLCVGCSKISEYLADGDGDEI